MPTQYTPRPEITSTYSTRTGPQSDLGYLLTQLGILCTNSGVRIRFHTGTFYSSPSQYTKRGSVISSYTPRPII